VIEFVDDNIKPSLEGMIEGSRVIRSTRGESAKTRRL